MYKYSSIVESTTRKIYTEYILYFASPSVVLMVRKHPITPLIKETKPVPYYHLIKHQLMRGYWYIESVQISIGMSIGYNWYMIGNIYNIILC